MNLFKDITSEYFDQGFFDINFSDLNLSEKVFDNCTFDNCDFTETKFERCKIIDCTFTNCNLSLVKFKDTSFSYDNFSDSKLIGINWTEARWPTIKLHSPLKFFNCVIDDSSFFGLFLREIVFNKCRVKNVDFREADLSLADMQYSDFSESLFIKTDLTKANFCHAINYSINISLNKIKDAKFMFPDAIGLLSGSGIILVED